MNDVIKKHCTAEWCEYVRFHSKKQVFNAGEYIFKAGEDALGLYIIEEGKVKVIINNNDGSERIIRLISNADILGHRGFGGDWKYSVSAIALEKSDLTFIPLSIFNHVMKANPDFAYYMMMFFAEELRESERLATNLPIRNVIASVLFNIYKVFGLEKESDTKLSFTLSRKDIANQAGTRYETVVRVLADLNKEEIIRIDGKALHILDAKRLEVVKNGKE